MLTKKEVEEMLAESNPIADHTLMKYGNYKLSKSARMEIMIRCIDAYEKIIQYILDKLDESSS